jgi:UDP-N-acetylmuramate--alanine ligase
MSKNVKCFSYPEALGELTKEYFTIAVSGSHGKSTTTSMLALALIKAGLDPTVIVGTKLKEFNNTNFRLGKR